MTIYLPASAEDFTPQPPRPALDVTEGHGEAVFVVEDELSVRRMIFRILTRAGYAVQEASPMEALEACARPDMHIDLLLTDVVMPTISGGELADRGRGLCPELKVLFMSGYVDETRLESSTYELAPLLQKPFTREELLHAIKAVLDQAAPAGAG